jgi:carbon monoxide dehydrogenase subunit G
MAIRIEERFQVRASIDRVWAWLVDPRQVVRCLPGAELTGEEDERTFLGRVKVKVGPVSAAYEGRATITERDDAARRVRIVGEGKESAGSGSAKMTLTSEASALDDGTTEVRVSADVDIVGKIVQFGRGMIESVNKQLFKQFVQCAQSTLEGGAAGASASGGAPSAGPPSPGPVNAVPQLAATMAIPAMKRPSPALSTSAPVPAPRASAPPAPPSSNAPRDAVPVRIVPLVLRALWDMIARLWRRG